MNKMIEATFKLHDHFNPSCGYQLRIEDASTGECLLFTSIHPAYGTDLLTARDCLDVIDAYVLPAKRQKQSRRSFLLEQIIKQKEWIEGCETNGKSYAGSNGPAIRSADNAQLVEWEKQLQELS